MLSKCRFILFTALFFCIYFTAIGQTDTLYVYEDVIIYDTVVVYDTVFITPTSNDFLHLNPKSISLLKLDTASHQANLLYISGQKTATIPINRIILDESFNENIKKLESMKKISFLGLMSIAFSSMVLAQSDYGISVGGGTWWAKCNNPPEYYSVSSAWYTPTSSINLYFKQALQNKFTFETSLGYKLLTKNKSYEVSYLNPDEQNIYTNYNSQIIVPYDPVKLPLEASDIPQLYIGEETSATNYHLIQIPLNIGYTLFKFNPYIGISYSLKMYNSSKSELIYDENNDQTSFVTYEEKGLNTFQHNLGFTAGVNYLINSKWSVGLNYYQSLTTDYKYNINIYDYKNENIASVNTYKWISRNIEFSVAYSLRKERKQQLETDMIE